jgi:peptide/nickel transport system permease protein
MLAFISRRITFIILVTILIIFAIYLGMGMIENSESNRPSYKMVPNSKLAWRNTRAFLSKALNGNLGMVETQEGELSVEEILRQSYINSMGLLLVGLVSGALIGLVVGTVTALIKHENLLLPVLMVTIIGISTPSFFAGLMLRQGELLYVKVFGHPLVSMAGLGWDYKHMLLPALVLAARPLAYMTRASYVAVNRTMEEDYIRTAFSKGLTLSRTVNVHALRNTAVPMLTAIGVSLRFSLSALPIVEFFFVWPGLGLHLLEAINQRQTVLVAALAAALGLTFLMINFLMDIAYRFIDPRMRANARM